MTHHNIDKAIKFYILLLCVLASSLVWAQSNVQDNCAASPDCLKAKYMYSRATQLWDSLSLGINYNRRSDSIDILHYDIQLDMTKMAEKKIEGICTIQFQSKKTGINSITLDLLKMQVDSVKSDLTINYIYNDTVLTCQFGQALMKGQACKLTVFYKGLPRKDKYWGGFYFKDDYAYNMGVGFVSDPHNYGRVWHPCFDNFKEKARYTFTVTTPKNKRAHCNGQLRSERIVDETNIRVWDLKEEIPTYLACIAVGDYTTMRMQHQSNYQQIPIELAAQARDTGKLLQSFKNLPKAIDAYEYWYGPHRWSKVGYTLVPFNSGAMEHATNIAYPIYAADGSLQRESLMAHELAHSWWGNLVTCASAQDMWINEGMASYSVHLFEEYTYGRARYLNMVKQNHYKVLQQAHIQEKGYRPIAAVPHRYTYGMHVYDKGASVLHNLRAYMGDSLFRKGLQYITKEYAFDNINTIDFRDALKYATGLDLDAYFEDWLFLGGYPHFDIVNYSVDSIDLEYRIKIVVRQQLVGRDKYYEKVPLQLSCYSKNGLKTQKQLILSGALDSVDLILPFIPDYMLLNEEQSINQARFDADVLLGSDTDKYRSLPKELQLKALYPKHITDSLRLYFMYHPVAPTKQRDAAIFSCSQKRYWSVRGPIKATDAIELSIRATAERDADLLGAEAVFNDSLVLLYRPDANSAWQLHPAFSRELQSKFCLFRFALLSGDYTFGVAASKPMEYEKAGQLYLEPMHIEQNKSSITVHLKSTKRSKVCLELYNTNADCVHRQCIQVQTSTKKFPIPSSKIKKGIYFVKVRNAEGRIFQTQKIAITD